MKILYKKSFVKSYKKLHDKMKQKVQDTLRVFIADPDMIACIIMDLYDRMLAKEVSMCEEIGGSFSKNGVKVHMS